MAKRKRSEELTAGIVVLVALILLAGILFFVSGGAAQFTPKSRYTVLFRDSGGVGDGDTVYLAGQKVGFVKDVEAVTRPDDAGVPTRYVAVTIEVERDTEIEVDSEIFVSKSITNIVEFHIQHGKSPELANEDTELKGTKLADFTETVDEAKLLLGDARKAVADADRAILKVDKLIDEIDMAGMQSRAIEFLDSLKRSGAKVETILADAKPRIDGTLDHVQDGARNLRELLVQLREDWSSMEPKVQAALDDLKGASGNLHGILAENRAPLKSLIQNLDDGSRRVAPVLDKLEALVHEAKGAVVELRPQLLGTVKRARAAMANFDALTEDLKTAPWKLINKPSDEEVREVALYNAARLYVGAATNLQRTIEDLDTLRRLGALEDAAKSDVVEKALEEMRRSLDEFEARQKSLVGLIVAPR